MMAETSDKIVIVGDGETAELAYEYFTQDSPHEVVAFAVERDYRKKEELFGLPVVAFEEIEARFPPASHRAFVSGYCEVGENCFLGVNSSVANNVKIARDCLIGMGAVIHKDTEEGKVYVGNPGKPIKDSFAVYGLREGE